MIDIKPRIFSHILLWGTLSFFVIALVWSNYAILDEVTKGEGKVIPSSQVQLIQHLEGGIVDELYVREGEVVEKGQKLMQIDNTIFRSSFSELNQKIAALKLKVMRLEAEVNDTPFDIPKELEQNHPSLSKAEKKLYESRKSEITQLKQAMDLAEQELTLSLPLVKRGAVSQVEILRLQRTVNELKSKLYKFQSDALEQLNTVKAELLSQSENLLDEEDRLTRTTIRSPVKGVINKIYVTTIGGVIKPGSDIMEVVPLDDTLLIEAKIKPQDIGFIRPGQDVTVKITAFDYSIYGGLKGIVEQISANTITEKKDGRDETFYLIRVRTDRNYLGTENKPLYIIPGMLATVDILTGEKSVLDYILKPILKAKHNALRER
ncbi:HlyD family type I secretion periplasmic adaptor subunit [Legionella sp. W05-934-2]|jgi:adhesin transport system membrane fusion protein|uniref:HlyD family type I secretion periplasmic adaptor subunit n=1 Tax=Legionella sp. W05-934-2 TaxID=1198649 RepID=UPI0034622AA8